MADTIVVTTQVPVVIEVAGPQGPQGPAGPSGSGSSNSPELGFALNQSAVITGADGNSETEFGGWGLGMQLADNHASGATMQPDGFRAYSGGTASVVVSGISNSEASEAFWFGNFPFSSDELTIVSVSPTTQGNSIVLVGNGTSELWQLIDGWNDDNPSNQISTTITVEGVSRSYDYIVGAIPDGFTMQFSGGVSDGYIAGIMGWGNPSGTQWSDLNGTYVKTAVAVRPSAWGDGTYGMHTPVTGTYNYYLSSPLSMGEPNPAWNGVAYFLAPGNRSGWGDPNDDQQTDPTVNYWRLVVGCDWPYTYFTNPSSDPYNFPTTGWVPVSASAPTGNEGGGYNGSNYLPNYAGGFSVATSNSGSSATTHLSSTALTLDNGAKLRKGTTDAGDGGSKGIALECSAQYELKWEAGRLYVLEQNGSTIRRVEHCFSNAPTANDDETKGFVVGSQWVLDNGTVYECTNSTASSAQWYTGGEAVETIDTPYILTTSHFTAEGGKKYAVGSRSIPAVMPFLEINGLRFTGTTVSQATYINVFEDGSFYTEDEGTNYVGIAYSDGVTTLQDVVDAMNVNAPTLVTIASGAVGTDFVVGGNGTLSGGSEAAFDSVEATLPTSPTVGSVISFADARGTWGANPLIVKRSSGPLPAVVGASHKPIEGSTANFTNNAAGTFFSMVFIDNTVGWRILSSVTKPLNLTAPTISGTWQVVATNGTWTGSPSTYGYQWQISDDGTTGWADIADATTAIYLAIEADETKFVRCGVSATNAIGPSAVVYSAASSAIAIPSFPEAGLLAFYNLNDDGSGELDLTDASGNGQTLTNNNGVTLSVGNTFGAASGDGTTYLTAPVSLPLTSGDVTISYWVKMTDTFNQTCIAISKFSGLNIARLPSGKIEINNFTSGAQHLSNAVIPLNEWVHICVIISNRVVTLYVDGALDTATGLATNTSDITSVNIFPAYPYHNFAGQMDAVGFWNRGLTEPEIAALYGNGAGLEL
jgi:hypothetical protein